MTDTQATLDLVRTILRDDPRGAILLSEILGPPPGLEPAPAMTWDEM